jgi:hypothetical protein
VVIQAKCYRGSVGNCAVQQCNRLRLQSNIIGLMRWVITNNRFTAGAKQLAQTNDVRLIDGYALQNRKFPSAPALTRPPEQHTEEHIQASPAQHTERHMVVPPVLSVRQLKLRGCSCALHPACSHPTHGDETCTNTAEAIGLSRYCLQERVVAQIRAAKG